MGAFMRKAQQISAQFQVPTAVSRMNRPRSGDPARQPSASVPYPPHAERKHPVLADSRCEASLEQRCVQQSGIRTPPLPTRPEHRWTRDPQAMAHPCSLSPENWMDQDLAIGIDHELLFKSVVDPQRPKGWLERLLYSIVVGDSIARCIGAHTGWRSIPRSAARCGSCREMAPNDHQAVGHHLVHVEIGILPAAADEGDMRQLRGHGLVALVHLL